MKNFLKNLFGLYSNKKTEEFPPLEVDETHIHYSNTLWEILSFNEENLIAMNQAMKENDFMQAEHVRKDWIENLNQYREIVNQIGDYKGNDFLLKATYEYIDDFEHLLKNGYKKLIEIRIKNGEIKGEEDRRQRDENNKDMEFFTQKWNLALDYFVQSYDSNGGFIDSSFNNPLVNTAESINTKDSDKFSPVHGFTIEDYASFGIFQMQGGTEEELCNILGIELPILHEVFKIWTERMQNDTSMEVTTTYSLAYTKGITNKSIIEYLGHKKTSKNSQKLQDDEKFYYEIQGALSAAYNLGIDGASWVNQYFGITSADLAIASTKWTIQTKNHNEMLHYQKIKELEYTNKIQSENNIPPITDIEF